MNDKETREYDYLKIETENLPETLVPTKDTLDKKINDKVRDIRIINGGKASAL